MTQVYDVIVVGCGAAGVAAMSRLLEQDSNRRVLGLEANDRLGGRIHTVAFGDNVVDLGGQWCHGEKNNAVFALAKDFNIIGQPSKQTIVFTNGEVLNGDETHKYHHILTTILRNANDIEEKSARPIGEFITTKYREALKLADFTVNSDIAELILQWFLKNIQAKLTSNALLEKSLNSVKESWDNEGETWLNWKDRGYKTIIDILLKKFPDPTKALPVEVILNKEVTNMKWNATQKGSASPNSLVQITCRDGSMFTCRHAIVTFPLGVLKERYESLFTPSLPDAKILAIRGVAVCTMNKIYIRFPKSWWPDRGMQFRLLWNAIHKKKFLDEDSWLTEIYAFTTVEMQPNLLCGWITGTAAEDMELYSTADLLSGVHRILRYFLGSTYEITNPTEILRSTWFTNSLARGSFSYRSVETEGLDGGAELLSTPLEGSSGAPVICFAGEATSLHHHSTVHGAVESGFREADRLISFLK